MTLVSQNTLEQVQGRPNKLGFPHQEKPMDEEPVLNTAQLCRALTAKFSGRRIHRDTIRKAIKMGLPYEINHLSGRKEFTFSKVLAWWIKSPASKAS